MPLLTSLATGGNPAAEVMPYEINWYGKGIPIDYAEGLKWARAAAAQGNADAAYGVALAYGFGLGMPLGGGEGKEFWRPH
jgi:TPR repeat protein